MVIIRIVVIFLILLLSACSSIGPRRLQSDRFNYNHSLQYSANQQLLLNILRLRYMDNTLFLSVSSIVAQLSLRSSLTSGLAKIESNPWSSAAESEIEYEDKPTITYIPLSGESLVRRFLTPISLKIVYNLLRSGWGVNHVLRTVVQRMNNIENAVSASRNVGGHPPKYKKFMRLSWALYKLQYSDSVRMRYGNINKRFAIKVTFSRLDQLNAEERRLLKELNITPSRPYMWLVDTYDGKPNHVYLETRTMLGFLNYLSKGVDIPTQHLKYKQAPMTVLPDGKYFDWRQVTHGMINIKSSKSRPQNAYVKIPYKGYWFYILDNDFDSKESFSLLNLLYSFQEGKLSQSQPVFTVS